MFTRFPCSSAAAAEKAGVTTAKARVRRIKVLVQDIYFHRTLAALASAAKQICIAINGKLVPGASAIK
ncbi:hypothetical protein CDQ92_10000 [Sphingopyxis bauzanensis]|uniref:Uncharacterized protein n=1 Tax=Sphingopyxis bauzanensis TaxID=651663 RepID=A0A246JWC0_9SPHN|nr:hypothetical protein CDQ92_10000 [Sphingopyxis bauzanensis]